MYKNTIMEIDLEYLKIKSDLLVNMSLEEFDSWKYIDRFGNKSVDVQYRDDLRIVLEKIERYDLLSNLFAENKK
jgi:hypothetical protein